MFGGCLLFYKRRAERHPYIAISVIFHAKTPRKLFVIFYNLTPVKVAPLKAVDKHFGGGDIGSHRDIVNIAKAQKRTLVRLVGLGVKWVTEKEQ